MPDLPVGVVNTCVLIKRFLNSKLGTRGQAVDEDDQINGDYSDPQQIPLRHNETYWPSDPGS